MKKILIVNNDLHLGGVQKALISLLNEIKDKYDITLFLLNGGGELKEEIPENIKIELCKGAYRCFGFSQKEAKKSLPLFCGRTFLAAVTKIFGRNTAVLLANLFQKKLKTRYDVAISFLHSASPKSFYGGCNEFVINKVNAKKKITILHGDFRRCGSDNIKTHKLYKKFHIVAACSEGAKESFIGAMPEMADRCVIVPNCHNFDRIKAQSLEDKVVYDKGQINILSVARLSPEKALHRGIKATAMLKKEGINACYHIVGDGIEKERLTALSRELDIADSVIFHGNQPNPYKYFPDADLLLITSYHEAAPLVIDEAASLGLPVLSTDTSSAQDMIVNRSLGWVCENNQTAINENLLELTSDRALLTEKREVVQTLRIDNSKAVKAFEGIVK